MGLNAIKLCQGIELDNINKIIIDQLIRSATSVGANYMEANGASSRRDFKNKIHICKKECQETKHWLKMFSLCEPRQKDKIAEVWKEAQQLTLIFGKIISTLNRKSELRIRN
ncbi:four helix bundle protein [Patescibacteria group bacterium]|nr:four helix bundle protein [Patescibacteria group bacterium]MBU1922036.1 four helix bundle protein [Patescibacteria group bacterium]